MKARRTDRPDPESRLEMLADELLDALHASVLHADDVRCIILLDSSADTDEDAALAATGFDADTEMAAMLLSHLQAVLHVNGVKLAVLPVGKPGGRQN